MSRTGFIVAITICIFITLLSMLGLAALIYREYSRRKQHQEARQYGRQSKYLHRLSRARKEVDNVYSRQYSGCLVQEPENPEMGSDSPIELLHEQRVWEIPAVPATPKMAAKKGNKRRSKAMSLFFNEGLGVWLPKR